eukprot:TRINITY_DN5146_c0_g1_i2.p1 TRINITY_DN5146_c0_g1~~TRINITY_DN5146_c0_g1_i2.p1  ORF type:complete len:379 (+),score=37.44 TRINITY_DN5146_c0_g1_i2:129-1265(+)
MYCLHRRKRVQGAQTRRKSEGVGRQVHRWHRKKRNQGPQAHRKGEGLVPSPTWALKEAQPPTAPGYCATDLGPALLERSMPKFLKEIERDPFLGYVPIRGATPLEYACNWGCSTALLVKLASFEGNRPPSDQALLALAGGPSAILDDGREDDNEESNRVSSARCLLRAGANPQARDASGRHVADVARQACRPVLAELITHYEAVRTCEVLRSICSKSSSRDSSQRFRVMMGLPEVMDGIYGFLEPELKFSCAQPGLQTTDGARATLDPLLSPLPMPARPAWPPLADHHDQEAGERSRSLRASLGLDGTQLRHELLLGFLAAITSFRHGGGRHAQALGVQAPPLVQNPLPPGQQDLQDSQVQDGLVSDGLALSSGAHLE